MASIIQNNAAQPSSYTSNAWTYQYPVLPTQGNKIAFLALLSAYANFVTSVTDNQTGSPNTYGFDVNNQGGSIGGCVVSCPSVTINTSPFILTINVNGPTKSGTNGYDFYELAGAGALDSYNSAAGSAVTAGSVTSLAANSQPNDIVLGGLITSYAGAVTMNGTGPSTGYTQDYLFNPANGGVAIMIGHRFDSGLTQDSASFGWSTAASFLAVIASYKATNPPASYALECASEW